MKNLLVKILAISLLLSFITTSYAQQQPAGQAEPNRPTVDKQKAEEVEEEVISDNSFMIEEAYNQEPYVVQHISTFNRNTQNNDWLYTFTQEWPVPSKSCRNQLSYTIQRQRITSAPDMFTGSGDTFLNYRYQSILKKDLAFSPRLSFVLPTGDHKKGLGRGATGLQINLPLSVRLSKKWVTHTNAGFTYTKNAKDPLDNKASTTDLNFGQSFIWLVKPNFNMMLETIWTRTQNVTGPGTTSDTKSFFLSPGMRWAVNYKSGLQVVPGIAFPTGFGPSKGQHGVFFYLSFEHPFGHHKKEEEKK